MSKRLPYRSKIFIFGFNTGISFNYYSLFLPTRTRNWLFTSVQFSESPKSNLSASTKRNHGANVRCKRQKQGSRQLKNNLKKSEVVHGN